MRRPWLLPLVPVYAAVVEAKALLRGAGVLPHKRLQGWVISVGSLSAGGAGKTPVVAMLVEMLQAEGLRVDILSRGYGRSGRGVERVDAAGEAARFGDEPTLLARQLGVPVWVANDRFAAGSAAESSWIAETASLAGVVHMLDDGFQHRRLERDVDVVLLTRQDVEDSLLPAGNLREGLSALRRAQVVVLREDEADGLRAHCPPGKRIWVVRRRIFLDGPAPSRPLIFCGIARPDGFLAMLVESGITPVALRRFADHHRYRDEDIAALTAQARTVGANGFCVTAKDAVKLTPEMLARLAQVGPEVVAELRVELVEGALGRLDHDHSHEKIGV